MAVKRPRMDIQGRRATEDTCHRIGETHSLDPEIRVVLNRPSGMFLGNNGVWQRMVIPRLTKSGGVGSISNGVR
jgi:hypothetical protein